MHITELDSITRQLSVYASNLEKCFVKWGHGDASEDSVSAEFVQLGNEFIAARHHLARAKFPVENLVDVPKELRAILEEALAMDASPEIAAIYGKQIRNVMSKLFHQLKAIHVQLKSSITEKAHTSQFNSGSRTYTPHQQYAQHIPQQNSHQTSQQLSQQSSLHSHSSSTSSNRQYAQPNSLSAQSSVHYQPANTGKPPNATHLPTYPAQSATRPQNSASTVTEQSKVPAMPLPRLQTTQMSPPRNPVEPDNDALILLQRNGALERQASKRYSTRQMSRIFNGAAEQITLPTTGVHKTFSTPEVKETNVVKDHTIIPETPRQNIRRRLSSAPRMSNESSTTSNKYSERSFSSSSQKNIGTEDVGSNNNSIIMPDSSPRDIRGSSVREKSSAPLVAESDEIYVFLRMGSRIRKAKITKPVSIAAIRLQFVEVCAYIPSGDEVFPEIMVQDTKTGVDYEVTEATVADITEGSLLTLNTKNEKEMHMENELKDIKDLIKNLAAKTEKLSSPSHASRSESTQRQQGGTSSTATYNASKFGSPVVTGDGRFKIEKSSPAQKEHSADKYELLIKEISSIKQFSDQKIGELQSQLVKLKTQLKELSTSSISISSSPMSMDNIRARVDSESQDLLCKFDDLADVIETLRSDVSKGVRFKQGEIMKVRNQLEAWKVEFEKSEISVIEEETIWRKNWQEALNEIVQCQDWSKTIKEMYSDLRNDLNQSTAMFELVCQANDRPRPEIKRAPRIAPPIEPGKEKEANNAVFNEIEALNISSERRVEAMADAMRRHKTNQILKVEEFKDDLSNFVAKSMLKPNGGFEEVERRLQEREKISREHAESSELEGKKLTELLKQQRNAQRQEAVAAAVAAKTNKYKSPGISDGESSVSDDSLGIDFNLGANEMHSQEESMPSLPKLETTDNIIQPAITLN